MTTHSYMMGYDDNGDYVKIYKAWTPESVAYHKQHRLAAQRRAVERRLAKLRVKGPINGKLYVCYDWRKPGRCATALTPEGALNAWRSYWSLIP